LKLNKKNISSQECPTSNNKDENVRRPLAKKVCKVCEIEKFLEDFYLNKQYKDGHYSKCKECFKKATRKNYSKNTEEILNKKQKYYLDNLEEIKKRKRIYYKSNKEKILKKHTQY
jgi:hypothetical protein